MTVGIIGLGLIGGSLAKAYGRDPAVTVLGTDADSGTAQFAKLAGVIGEILTEETLPTLDLLLLAVPPVGVVETLTALAPKLPPHTTVIDCAGTKERVCAACFPLAEKYGFSFFGGHPMAGTQFSGLKHSREDLFDGAPMVIVPPSFDDIAELDRVKTLLAPAGFGRVSFITAQEHDRRIAFTSQLAHVVSNAYVKSPTAQGHEGFSAGSYRDLTRVAWLNAPMWTELFLENRESLLREVDTFMEHLAQYRDALAAGDGERLERLLEEGKRRKEAVDG